ncbi:deoxyribose-phosphate aldolase [Viridothelium virens]|uniref:deoxyribose-phosphate aldolase n=1 Tax=Viridothelium virens TaxID=1048519 RepID=A0A6A6H4A4_VIRVR|nr:deoxyribose-phosphate aldolase [Viridothelium virens]
MSNPRNFSTLSNDDWVTFISGIEEGISTIKESQDRSSDASSTGHDAILADSINSFIDHTQLKTDATLSQIDQLGEEAKEYSFKTVCVRLDHVARCVAALKDTSVGVACVIGFHEGTHPTASKVAEARSALQAGASELDIVLNYPLLLSDVPQYSSAYSELRELREEAGSRAVLKLIIETSQLDRHQIIAACALAHAAEFNFVKTSTGFKGHGATTEDVRLMRSVVGFLDQREAKGRVTTVKASGGIRTWEDALAMVTAGATRIGASSGVAIVKEAQGKTARVKDLTDRSGGY